MGPLSAPYTVRLCACAFPILIELNGWTELSHQQDRSILPHSTRALPVCSFSRFCFSRRSVGSFFPRQNRVVYYHHRNFSDQNQQILPTKAHRSFAIKQTRKIQKGFPPLIRKSASGFSHLVVQVAESVTSDEVRTGYE